MNYDNYLKQLEELGGANEKKTEPKENKDNKKKLADFYHINKSLIRSFYAINRQIEQWLQSKLDDYGVNQILNALNQNKPILASLKYEVSQTNISDFEGTTRNKLEKQLGYIKNEMMLEEVNTALQNIKQLKNEPKRENTEEKGKMALLNFYNLNLILISFFSSIQTQIELWLQSQNLDDISISHILNYLNQQKHALANIRYEITQINISDYEDIRRAKLEQHITFIKNKMMLEEADFALQTLKQLKNAPKAEPKPETPKNDSNFLRTFLKTEYGEGYTYEGSLLNNLPNGNGGLYYPNKQLYAIGTWVNGRLENHAKTYYNDGKLWQEGNFVNGKLEGFGKEYYYYTTNENKEVVYIYEGEFRYGNLAGEINVFTDGKIKMQGFIEPNGRIRNAKVFFYQDENTYYFNGNISNINKLAGTMVGDGEFIKQVDIKWIYKDVGNFKISWKDEWAKIFGEGKVYLNNVLWKEGYFSDGFQTRGKSYYEGKLDFEGEYQIGSKGFEIYKRGKKYHANGIVSEEGDFSECNMYGAKLDGNGTKYFGNGKIDEVGEFKLGKLHGKGERHFPDGGIQEKGYFIDGKLEGINGIRYGYGEIINEDNLPKNAQIIKRAELGDKYFYVHVVTEIGTFKEGKLHGVGKRYNYLGRLECEGTFINGVFQGK